MAKKNRDETQGETQAQTTATPDAGVPTITIQGLTFQYTAPYAEGQPLTANLAGALNNLRGENLRNNFASKIKAKLEPKGGPKREATDLTPDEVTALGVDFAAYDQAYELSGKRVAKAPVDPVEREATRIAKEQVDAALRRKGIEKKALADGQYDGYVISLLERNPAIREEARAYIEQVRSAAAGAMADDLIGAAA